MAPPVVAPFIARSAGVDDQYPWSRYCATLSAVTMTVGSTMYFSNFSPCRIFLASCTARPPMVGRYDIEAPYCGSFSLMALKAEFEPPIPVTNWMSVRFALRISVSAPIALSSSCEKTASIFR